MSDLKEALSAIESKLDSQLKTINEQVVDHGDASKKEYAELKSIVSDVEAASKEMKKEVLDMQQKSFAASEPVSAKSAGESVVDSTSFAQFKDGSANKCRVELKNTVLNSGNDTSLHDQMSGVVAGAMRQLTVMPTVARGMTNSNSVFYSRESSFTNNAAIVAEGVQKPESDITFEEVNQPISTFAHFLKVSKQALDDSAFLASYLDQRLRHGVDQVIEDNVIGAVNGWLKVGNNVATDPLNTGDIIGLANKMKYEVIAADRNVDYYYMNPADWGTVETGERAKGGTTVSYINSGMTPLLWGLPVVTSNSVPAGTIIAKSINADMYVDRSGVVVEMFEQDDTNVQTNLITVRAEARGAYLNFVPSAIRVGDIASIT